MDNWDEVLKKFRDKEVKSYVEHLDTQVLSYLVGNPNNDKTRHIMKQRTIDFMEGKQWNLEGAKVGRMYQPVMYDDLIRSASKIKATDDIILYPYQAKLLDEEFKVLELPFYQKDILKMYEQARRPLPRNFKFSSGSTFKEYYGYSGRGKSLIMEKERINHIIQGITLPRVTGMKMFDNPTVFTKLLEVYYEAQNSKSIRNKGKAIHESFRKRLREYGYRSY